MIQDGRGALETPRTDFEEHTYLTNPNNDYDESEDHSLRSPLKNKYSFMKQLQDSRLSRRKTTAPHSRLALDGRRNLPGLGAGEFTPMLRIATRNSALRSGKEDVTLTPRFLKPEGMDNIPEDLSPLPPGSSTYADSRLETYLPGTPAHQNDFSSNASTPKSLLSRGVEGPDFAQGNKPSLREQESLVDKYQKQNFSLKLKIEFLERNLEKLSPGYNEDAIRENTELKVEKVTMERELRRCRKSLKAAKLDLEAFRKQFLQLQENVKSRQLKDDGREQILHLKQVIEEKEREINAQKSELLQLNDLRHKVFSLETDIEEKNRSLNERDIIIKTLKKEAETRNSDLHEYRLTAERLRHQLKEVEGRLRENKDSEGDLKNMEMEIKNLKDEREIALKEKERAEANLQELQEEMADKSIFSKGFNRQIEEKASRLQQSLEETREKCYTLEKQLDESHQATQKLSDTINQLKLNSQTQEQTLGKRVDALEREKEFAAHERESLSKSYELSQKELQCLLKDKNILLSKQDTLTKEISNLQRDLRMRQNIIDDLEERIEQEKVVVLQNEQRISDNHKAENDSLSEEIEHLKSQIHENQRKFEVEYDKWDYKIQNLKSEKELSDEKALDLQRMIERLSQVEGTLSDKEAKLQHALQDEMDRHREQEATLNRQIAELNKAVQARQKALSDLKIELITVDDELRLSHQEQKMLMEKVQGLEDEIEVLQTNLDEETEEFNRDRIAAEQESENLRLEIQHIRSDLDKAKFAASEAQAEINKFRANLQIGEGNTDRINARLSEIEEKLVQAEQEKSSLKDQLSKVDSEFCSLQKSKEDLEIENREIKNQIRNFQDEIKGAHEKEVRLTHEVQDLKSSYKASSDKRELATAKSQILTLQTRIRELESQLIEDEYGDNTLTEVSILRRDLKIMREKETEYVEREANQRDVIRSLMRQITALERKTHQAEISRYATRSPQTPGDQSTLNVELTDLRTKLANAHQSIKDLRTQLKNVEREAQRKTMTTNAIDTQARSQDWEPQKNELERSHNQAQSTTEVLEAKYKAAEVSITRLRSKIDRLQRALQAERRLNAGDNKCIDLSQKDVYEMLADAHRENESLEALNDDQKQALLTLSSTETDLRSKIKRLRDERTHLRAQVAVHQDQIDQHQRQFQHAKDTWEAERHHLTHGVRFANVSSSISEESHLHALKLEYEARERLHIKEMRGATLQLEWLRAKCSRAEFFRSEAAFAKRFMGMQISLFEACNQADIELLQRCGIKRPPLRPRRPVTIKRVGSVIRAIIRMKKGAKLWAEKRKVEQRLEEQMSRQKKIIQLEIPLRNSKVLDGSRKKMIES